MNDLLVIVDLALVVRENRSADLSRRRRAAVREEHFKHYRLVNVRHPHLGVEKLDKTLVCQRHTRIVAFDESRDCLCACIRILAIRQIPTKSVAAGGGGTSNVSLGFL